MITKFNKFINESRKKIEHSDIPEENQGGDCYIQGYRYFMQNYQKNPNLRLCHGLVTGQGKISGIKYNHCWCEDIKTEMVYDMTMPEFFRNVQQPVYYYFGKINRDEVYKYDINQVNDKIAEFKTYGPWEETLLKNKY